MNAIHTIGIAITIIGAIMGAVSVAFLGLITLQWLWWVMIPMAGLWFRGLAGLCFGLGLDVVIAVGLVILLRIRYAISSENQV